MSDSVLTSTKKTLGLAEDYTAFDLDIITFINGAFGVVNQLGVGQGEGFFIVDDEDLWSDFEVDGSKLALVKTYVYLRVRMLFDPPSTSFHIEACEKQLKEYEWRLHAFRESELVNPDVFDGYDILDGNGP